MVFSTSGVGSEVSEADGSRSTVIWKKKLGMAPTGACMLGSNVAHDDLGD